MIRPVFDEMTGDGGSIRDAYRVLRSWLDSSPPQLLQHRSEEAELFFRKVGITFAVYGNAEAEERLIPFDVIPRIFSSGEWSRLSRGLEQRVKALNLFLSDLYGKREILRAGIVPQELVFRNPYFRPQMNGLAVRGGIYVQVAGIDIVRVDDEDFYVLEDNLRTPSGVSYMLENREVMLRLFPDLMAMQRIRPIDNYVDELFAALKSISPGSGAAEPRVVLLTPGPLNSAYYEHSFLADRMGVELVEGRDLFVRDEIVYMRTTEGPRRVDVIYSRIDDDYLDPLVFRPDSALGVPGLISAYRSGNVTIANAPGTGVADDKAIYSYVPDIIRFYLGEDPILKNVPTWRCREKEALAYVLDNLHELVVKEVNGSGGYGMLVGPHATNDMRERFRAQVLAAPDNYIAQPTLALSTSPVLTKDGLSPRHVDLRPFVLTGLNGVRIVPGGLTRVALTPGSLVVNSSQGGGTKDTWVLSE
ncbi:circularly permuted type 2 ATP-grasp protein [Microvirga puerhi]|uniref:Circularly permuted type 2 ATP-grasp protein n=1 Tax=Microvirga puerhi TaxID=2876078 RepID=A0ABS7VND5_9HYPH|nr:circularly permuted type 2 ATP-grasp protein [Microvirga puerhi]MBZ6076645.1 circularly permuted type 2 ATP-grasp protein [Microvirga puerhi]